MPDVVMLLAGEATKLVVLGVLIAIPFAYFLVQAWLARFADRVEVGFGTFAAAGLIAVAIAWVTVSYLSIRAGLVEPVKILRYE